MEDSHYFFIALSALAAALIGSAIAQHREKNIVLWFFLIVMVPAVAIANDLLLKEKHDYISVETSFFISVSVPWFFFVILLFRR